MAAARAEAAKAAARATRPAPEVWSSRAPPARRYRQLEVGFMAFIPGRMLLSTATFRPHPASARAAMAITPRPAARGSQAIARPPAPAAGPTARASRRSSVRPRRYWRTTTAARSSRMAPAATSQNQYCRAAWPGVTWPYWA
ncbi:MAG: hypothetical protein NT031_12160 [Planctomycetota bacterium]|nr:hypothetical protein [Planctomycetota bacterium]